MRFFYEETGNKTPKETAVIIEHSESLIIVKALEEFIKNNPKQKKAKALLQEMEDKWGIY